jgi:hypothetical protein
MTYAQAHFRDREHVFIRKKSSKVNLLTAFSVRIFTKCLIIVFSNISKKRQTRSNMPYLNQNFWKYLRTRTRTINFSIFLAIFSIFDAEMRLGALKKWRRTKVVSNTIYFWVWNFPIQIRSRDKDHRIWRKLAEQFTCNQDSDKNNFAQ